MAPFLFFEKTRVTVTTYVRKANHVAKLSKTNAILY